MFQRITLLRVSLGIVMVLSIPAVVGQTGSPENGSGSGRNSYRVSAETRCVDQLRSEESLDVLLDKLGSIQGLVGGPVLRDNDPDRTFPYIVWNRRLAKVIALLHTLPRQEASAAIIKYSMRTRQLVAERIVPDLDDAFKVKTLEQLAAAAKRKNAEVNWYSANHCAVFLTGRYAPEELVAYEKEMKRAAGAAVAESIKIDGKVAQEAWIRAASMQVYPKLLWANVYRLALKRNGLDVPDEAAYATVLRELTFRKWDAIAKLPETGSGLGSDGRRYSDADTLETIEVIREWPLSSPYTDFAGQELYLSRLRDAVQKQWPKDVPEPDRK